MAGLAELIKVSPGYSQYYYWFIHLAKVNVKKVSFANFLFALMSNFYESDSTEGLYCRCRALQVLQPFNLLTVN